MIRYHRFATPLGIVFATAVGGAVTGLYYEGGRHAPAIDPRWTHDPRDEPLVACEKQLLEYLKGMRKRFELVLSPQGTPFQQRIWKEIAGIPYGEVITYAELARRALAPQSSRAAGAATGRNPLSIIVPCHRVVGSHGSLTGYAGGLERKQSLLALEGVLLAAAA
jgi:methylated-DNA-[protein]-cysteine S-methyltransferase